MQQVGRQHALRTKLAGVCIVLGVIGGAGCAPPPQGASALPRELQGLQLQATRGNAIAANALGVIYADGTRAPQDFGEARKWFQFASEHGNPGGEFNLGLLYLNGRGTPVDTGAALRWFRSAADHNFAPAQLELGSIYLLGKGVPQDDNEAQRWIRAAAVQGFGPAQLMLSLLYSQGRGVEPDDGEAYEWASLAAVRMPAQTQAAVSKLRDNLANTLPAPVLAAAQSATALWKPGMDMPSPFPPNAGPRPARVRGTGSGFVIGKGGEIATDYHVVPNCREIRVKDSGGRFNVLTHVIGSDKTADLALLAGGGFGTHLKLRGKAPSQGESVVTYGYPLGQVLSSGGNLTNGSVSSTSGMESSDKSFQISAPVQPGSSGGPVVDQSGAVIGIVVTKLNALAVAAATGDIAQNVNFATHARLLRTLMDSTGTRYELAGQENDRTNTDLADALQKATVKVECWR